MKTVWAKDRLIKNDELCFVYKAPKLDNAKLNVVGRDVYNVYVNGEFVSYGPVRAAHDYVREEQIDISKYLTKDENFIVFNIISYYVPALAFTEEHPLLGVELSSNGKIIAEASDFECYSMTDRFVKTERFSSQRSFVEHYHAEFDRSEFYKGNLSLFPKLEINEVECPTIIGAGCKPFKYEIREAELFKTNNVKYVDNPPWTEPFFTLIDILNDGEKHRTYSRKDCDRVTSYVFNDFKNVADGEDHDAVGYTYKFERDITGKVVLGVSAKEDVKIYAVYDEILSFGDVSYNREMTIHGFAWEVKAGDYELVTFEPYTLQYVKFVIEGNAEIKYVKSITVENPDTGSFSCECDDKDIKDIITAAKHSLEQNACDTLTDCPSRERAAWLCDSFFSSQAERLFTGKNLVERNHLENYALYHGMDLMPKYVLPMCYPSQTTNGNFIPNWMCWFVFEVANYARNTGDTSLYEQSKARVEDVVNFFAQYENEFGLLEDLPGWVFIEWSACNDYVKGVNFPSNMLYSSTLECAGEILGRPELIEKGKRLKKVIEEMSFNGEFFCDDAIRVDGKLVTQTHHTTETCQYYAMFFDVATEEKYGDLIKTMVEDFGPLRDDKKVYPNVSKSNMFIGNYVRLEILRRARAYEKIVETCVHYLLIPARTTSSLWENVVQRPDMQYRHPGSCCHGFAAAAGNFLTEALTGFRGFSTPKKEIYMTGTALPINAKFTLPIDDEVCTIENKDGVVTLIPPKGYKVINI